MKTDLSQWDEDFHRLQDELARWEPYVDFMRALWEELTTKYCPLNLVFYRKNKPKLRYDRRLETRMQNINSYTTVCMRDFNELGEIRRILKHRGFHDLIAILDASPYDVATAGYSWRTSQRKWKHMNELALAFDLTPTEANDLAKRYPTKAWGQLQFT
mgnify:CR=1 FL=1